MATAYVVKGYGKGYVAMNPWRYTQVSAGLGRSSPV